MSDQQRSRREVLKVGAIGLGTVGGAAFFPSIAAAAPGEAATAVLPANPTFQYFLEISGIAGDSVDKTYRNQIVVRGWSWGLSNSSVISGGGGGAGVGKSTPMDFIYVAPVSVASPPTALSVATGRRRDHAVLTVVGPGPTPTKRMTVRMVDVLVSSYQQSSGDTDGFPLDVVNLTYGKLIYSVYPQNPDGSVGSPVVTTFDFRTQKAS